MIEDNNGPWGSMVVLAQKAKQENTPWTDFIWRICISYRGINQIIRIHRFPYRRCDDTILHIGKSSFRISIDLDSGYWQVPVDKASRPKLEFFGDRKKLCWTGMPMGAVNSSGGVVLAQKAKQGKTSWTDFI